MEVVRDGVFQHFRQLGQAEDTKVTLLGNFMKDARLEIVKPSLLTKAVEVIKTCRWIVATPKAISTNTFKQADHRRDQRSVPHTAPHYPHDG